MTKWHRIGSVSSGTMNPSHLIPAFLDALDDCKELLALSCAPGDEIWSGV